MGAGVPKVYIVGAGPGDPELITVKGAKLLSDADVVVYAGSLVNPELLKLCKKACLKINSHGMKLQEMADLMAERAKSGELVVRLSSGDPSVYGSLKELKEELEVRGVQIEVVPGVSSLFAGAASLKEELTVPEGPQSVVITRLSGKTPVRPQESLERFAATGATVALFLSAHRLMEIRERLLRAGVPPNVPVCVVYKASWKEEKILETTVGDLGDIQDIKGSSIVYVLPGRYLEGRRSYLYGGEPEEGEDLLEDTFNLIPVSSTPVLSLIQSRCPNAKVSDSGGVRKSFDEAWEEGYPLVVLGPVGVAARLAARHLKDKFSDPPVLCVDVAGSFVVVLTGGHHGGNRLAKRLASVLGAVPVITTGTEVLGVPSLEELMEERGLRLLMGNTKLFNSLSLKREPIYSLGLGWRRNASCASIEKAVRRAFAMVPEGSLAVVAVPQFKGEKAEECLYFLDKDVAVVAVPEDVLKAFPGPSLSRAKDKLGVPGAAEPCALAVLPEGRLVVEKHIIGDVTFALACWRMED